MSGGGLWRPAGLGWSDGAAALEWTPPGGGDVRSSPLPVGTPLAFTVGPDRRCAGVRRGGRRLPCATAAELPGRVRGALCPACAALDRSSSIAADTRADDPRPFSVYLAHHGGTVKVGITGAARGAARLLEQGALSSVVLSTGPLMAARRCESLLATALGLPDRVATARKRAARAAPGTPGERAGPLAATAARALALPGWPQAQRPGPGPVTDHVPAYGLPAAGLAPVAEVGPLTPGATVTGRVLCRIGPDVYLAGPAGPILLDTRLTAGWALRPAPPGAALTAALLPVGAPPPALF